MALFNFSANAVDFGDVAGETQTAAQDIFAQGAGYLSWDDMCDSVGDNEIVVTEIA